MSIKSFPDTVNSIACRISTSFILNLAIILSGIFLRLKYYWSNCSVWVDEAWVAVSIAGRSWQQILNSESFAYDAATPPVIFGLLQKAVVEILGYHEYALRLFPLLSGLLTLILFYHWLKSSVPKAVVPLALVLLALNPAHIFYSVTIKQYASDVLVVLMIYVLADRVRQAAHWHRFVQLGVAGALGLWLSNASIFVLGAVGLTFSGTYILEKKWSSLIWTLVICIFWGGSFWGLYQAILAGMSENKELFHMWKGFFATIPGWSWAAVPWGIEIFVDIFRDPAGLVWPAGMAVLFGVGCCVSFRRDKQYFCRLVLPLLLAFLAACLHKYPFKGRMVLFALPMLFAGLAEGAGWLITQGRKAALVVGCILIVSLLLPPLQRLKNEWIQTHCYEDTRTLMHQYKDHFQRGDFLLINDFAQPQFWFYAASLDVDIETSRKSFGRLRDDLLEGYIIGQLANRPRTEQVLPFVHLRNILCVYDEEKYIQKFLTFRGEQYEHKIFAHTSMRFLGHKRIWIFLANYEVELKDLLTRILDRQAKRLKTIDQPGAALYLYEFGDDFEN